MCEDTSHLVRVGIIGTTVAGISHFVTVSIFLVSIWDPFAVVKVIGNSWG